MTVRRSFTIVLRRGAEKNPSLIAQDNRLAFFCSSVLGSAVFISLILERNRSSRFAQARYGFNRLSSIASARFGWLPATASTEFPRRLGGTSPPLRSAQ